MDYTFPASNTSSCCSSAAIELPGKDKTKKSTRTYGGDGAKRSKGGGTVKLSTDPQSVAARERRHRISDRFKILQSLVPGGTKMDTVSMLDEAIHYVKFLKTQIWLHQTIINFVDFDHNSNSAAATAADQLNYSGLDQIGGGEVNHFLYPQNDAVKLEELSNFLPQLDPNGVYFSSGQDQFLCSYDPYMN